MKFHLKSTLRRDQNAAVPLTQATRALLLAILWRPRVPVPGGLSFFLILHNEWIRDFSLVLFILQ